MRSDLRGVPSAVLVWFRLDLRLADNPALQAAIERGGPVVPAFIYSPEEETPWEPGAASRWWLQQSLLALQADLKKFESRLVIRRGPTVSSLLKLAKEIGASAVYWNRRYEPAVIARDAKVHEALSANDVEVQSFNGALLHEPGRIMNQSGKPFQVFTPFWRRCLASPAPSDPLPAPRRIVAPVKWVQSIELDVLELEPKIKWA